MNEKAEESRFYDRLAEFLAQRITIDPLKRVRNSVQENSWRQFKGTSTYRNVLELFMQEFSNRLASCMTSGGEKLEQHPNFRSVALTYRDQYCGETTARDQTVALSRAEFEQVLQASLADGGDTNHYPRLMVLIKDQYKVNGAVADELKVVFAECFETAFKLVPERASSEQREEAADVPSRGPLAPSGGGSAKKPVPDSTLKEQLEHVSITTSVPAPKSTSLATAAAESCSLEHLKAFNNPTAYPPAGALTDQKEVKVQEIPASAPKTMELSPKPVQESTVPAATPWLYKPIPHGPDKHDEYDGRSGKSTQGHAIVGGRVRGKKHKHEGTNCDDWFEFAASGPWTIMAVSDGGGSYKFSRIGARISSQTVVARLVASLSGLEFAELGALAAAAKPEEFPVVVEKYRALVGGAIKSAMRDALQQVLKRIGELNSGLEYHSQASGGSLKPLTLRDFYATLLVAVHVPLQVAEKTYSFVMGCGCGDGMIGVISKSADPAKACTLLMKADSGDFSGETEFLNEKALQDDAVQSRLYPALFGELRALILMTDGVADDYFPNNPGIAATYADLILNRIVPAPASASDPPAVTRLQDMKVQPVHELGRITPNVSVYRILPEGPKQVQVASLEKLGEQLGLKPENLATSYELLGDAVRSCPDPTPDITSSEDRLVHWLDSYTVRGSFDDRTLLVMTPPTFP